MMSYYAADFPPKNVNVSELFSFEQIAAEFKTPRNGSVPPVDAIYPILVTVCARLREIASPDI